MSPACADFFSDLIEEAQAKYHEPDKRCAFGLSESSVRISAEVPGRRKMLTGLGKRLVPEL